MRKLQLMIAIAVFFPLLRLNSQVITNIYGRNLLSLNGKWNYTVEPYETGYYDYRYKPYDENPNPSAGFFLDQEPKNKWDIIEYSFEKSPTLWVPGDWNSQDYKLPVSYTHLRAHETRHDLVCRLLLEKK